MKRNYNQIYRVHNHFYLTKSAINKTQKTKRIKNIKQKRRDEEIDFFFLFIINCQKEKLTTKNLNR